jgi:hypothetical protein
MEFSKIEGSAGSSDRETMRSLIGKGVEYLMPLYVDMHGIAKTKTVPVSHFDRMMRGLTVACFLGFIAAQFYFWTLYFDPNAAGHDPTQVMIVAGVFQASRIPQASKETRSAWAMSCIHAAAPPAIIAAWLANHVNKFAEIHRFVKIALDFRGAHEGDPDIANTIESFYVEERKLLSRVIREGIRQGMFKPVDPNRMAQFISTYLDGCMVRSVILPDFDLKGALAVERMHLAAISDSCSITS